MRRTRVGRGKHGAAIRSAEARAPAEGWARPAVSSSALAASVAGTAAGGPVDEGHGLGAGKRPVDLLGGSL